MTNPRGTLLFLIAAGLAGSCTTSTTDAGDRVRVVDSRAEVAGCRYLGVVHVDSPVYTAMGGFIGAAADRANIRKNRTAELGGDTLLRLGGDDDEAYSCARSSTQAAQNRGLAPTTTPVPTAVPTPTPSPKPTKVKIVGNEDDVRGCIFIDSIDQLIDCPADFPPGVPCMAFRANLQGGNVVLARGGGKVYKCPTPK